MKRKPVKIGILLVSFVLVCSLTNPVMAAGLEIAVSPDPAIVNQILTVTVTKTADGSPVEGAMVEYILNQGTPIQTFTDASGISTWKPQLTGTLVINAYSDTVLTGTRTVEVVEVAVPPNITAWSPVEAEVSDIEGASRTFNVTVDQTVNVTWLINGTQVYFDESVTEANYTNASVAVGYWNVSAIAENANGTDMHTWMWNVTPTPEGYRAVTLVYNDQNIGYNFIAWTGNETNASSLAALINESIPGSLPTGYPVAYYNTTKGYFDGFIVGENQIGSEYDFTIPQYGVVSVRVAKGGTFLMPVAF